MQNLTQTVTEAEQIVVALQERDHAGDPPTADQVRLAVGALRDAHDLADFAAEAERGQIERENKTRIEKLGNEARALENTLAVTLGKYRAAAVVLDDSMQNAKRAADSLNDIGYEIGRAAQAARDHNNYTLATEVAGNPVLKAMHASMHPKCALVDFLPPSPLGCLVRAEIIVTSSQPMSELLGRTQ